jgi:hypothetical protein
MKVTRIPCFMGKTFIFETANPIKDSNILTYTYWRNSVKLLLMLRNGN